MIPKKIHYCWFGGRPLGKLGQKCFKSWQKFFPEYDIIEWNESNFDVSSCKYAKEAYEAGKWAFVSDYARYKILYDEGGIYFDTDVEVIASFDEIIERGAFVGCENPDRDTPLAINPGLGFGAEARHPFLMEMVREYEESSFYNDDGTENLKTIVERTTERLEGYGAQNKNDVQSVAGVSVYPAEYFCPINMNTGELKITPKTRSIHRYSGSWVDKGSKIRGKIYFLIVRFFGERTAKRIRKIFGKNEKK
jgi:mannosyltransferase OCH1-like enzyme